MGQPGKTNGVDFAVDSGTVGVGLPIIIRFTYSVPNSMRKAVQDAIQIKTSQPVEGAWKWWSSDELHFRTKDYWQPGTKIQVKAAIGGVDMGDGRYGKRDRTASMTVGPKINMEVDNKTHKAKVYKDGQLLKTLPASLGKRSTPSSSGFMLVQEKRYHVVMDSCTYGVCKGEPGYYREDVYWDVRYTDGGEFVHAAPWSVDSQGNSNVSHGCVNLSTSNAKWFYNLAKPGDIVHIVNTAAKVKPGDGWTDWELSWDTLSKSGVVTTQQL
jgi:lipoprotein-anchoring transpeptidase ErfK/SrfK